MVAASKAHDGQARMNPRKLPRPRIQSAFVQWFRSNRHRFSNAVRIARITQRSIEIAFPAMPVALSASLSRTDLSVLVSHQGVLWDMLLSLDAFPESDGHGQYRCLLCTDSAQTWPTREALWEDHLFEPFLEWVNRRLDPPREIQFHGSINSITCAELRPSSDAN
jgi:hypothetical protein